MLLSSVWLVPVQYIVCLGRDPVSYTNLLQCCCKKLSRARFTTRRTAMNAPPYYLEHIACLGRDLVCYTNIFLRFPIRNLPRVGFKLEGQLICLDTDNACMTVGIDTLRRMFISDPLYTSRPIADAVRRCRDGAMFRVLCHSPCLVCILPYLHLV